MNDKFASYSYIPDSNTPTTLNSFILGISPTGVTRETGETIDTISPTPTPNLRKSSLPKIIPARFFFSLPFISPEKLDFVFKSDTVPDTIFFPKSETVSSFSGSIPRTTIPETLSPLISIT